MKLELEQKKGLRNREKRQSLHCVRNKTNYSTLASRLVTSSQQRVNSGRKLIVTKPYVILTAHRVTIKEYLYKKLRLNNQPIKFATLRSITSLRKGSKQFVIVFLCCSKFLDTVLVPRSSHLYIHRQCWPLRSKLKKVRQFL